MIILLKTILGLFAIASIVLGSLAYREFRLFNKDAETKNTSLGERIVVNSILIIVWNFLFLYLINN